MSDSELPQMEYSQSNVPLPRRTGSDPTVMRSEVPATPTASACPEPSTPIASSSSLSAPANGVQLWPSKCSRLVPAFSGRPTAQASPGPFAATPNTSVVGPFVCWLAVQPVAQLPPPFQCSTTRSPPIQTSPVPLPATAWSSV